METKEVTLPSGRTVKVRRPGVLTMQKIYGVLPSLAEGGSRAALSPVENLDYMVTLVCCCVVEPKVSREGTAGAEFVEDWDQEDVFAAVKAIGELMPRREDSPVTPLSTTGTA